MASIVAQVQTPDRWQQQGIERAVRADQTGVGGGYWQLQLGLVTRIVLALSAALIQLPIREANLLATLTYAGSY